MTYLCIKIFNLIDINMAGPLYSVVFEHLLSSFCKGWSLEVLSGVIFVHTLKNAYVPASTVCGHLCYLIYFLQWMWQVKIVILVLDKENISLRLFIGLVQSFTSSCVTRSLLIPSNLHYFSLKGHHWDRLWEFPLC